MANTKKVAVRQTAKKSSVNNDFSAVVDQLLASLKADVMVEIKELMERFDFPDKSIPFDAIDINPKSFISGNNIHSGTISQFSSKGIEDLAKETQLTVMDNAVVIENQLVSQRLSVKGNLEVDGNVTIRGETAFDVETKNKLLGPLRKEVCRIVSADLAKKIETISGDRITGGTVTKFSSTGIEDLAEDTQLTVMDDMVVVENKLAADTLFVKGDTTIEGNLLLLGDMPLDENTRNGLISDTADAVHSQITDDLKVELVNRMVEQIKDTQFDVKNILIAGRPLIDGTNSLAAFIRESRLTRVSTLKELQVSGETQLCGSFYAGNNRVGINTTQPAAALSIWDEEVELVMGKHSANRTYIGTLRPQEVIFGAHNKTNIILATNGLTAIKTLRADKTRFYSEDKVPSFESEIGAVCFNTKPKVGEPFGWMCLGGARWAIMGLLE